MLLAVAVEQVVSAQVRGFLLLPEQITALRLAVVVQQEAGHPHQPMAQQMAAIPYLALLQARVVDTEVVVIHQL